MRPPRRYGGRITGSWKCDSSEITIEFPAFSPTSFSSTPRLSVFKLRFSPLCLSDGSITGAMLRELLKLSLSGCVSSNVSARAFQPAHRAGKRKERRRGGGESLPGPPNDARWEPSHAKFCWVVFPRFLSRGPQTPIYRQSHIGPFCLVGPEQLHSAEKNDNNQIRK